MRDPKRRDRILDKLNQVWKYYLDLRFYQLIYNIKFSYIHNHYCTKQIDCFYIEDEEFEKTLDLKLKDIKGK